MNITGENIIDLLALIQKGALSETTNQHLYIELESNILNEALNLSGGNKDTDGCKDETTQHAEDKLISEMKAFKAMCNLMNLGTYGHGGYKI